MIIKIKTKFIRLSLHTLIYYSFIIQNLLQNNFKSNFNFSFKIYFDLLIFEHIHSEQRNILLLDVHHLISKLLLV
jgi:hypothetical protein